MLTMAVNGRTLTVTIPGDTPLLWLLREQLQLTGTKFGCGAGLCGACTVLINGHAVRACSVPVSSLDGAEIVTIEGLDRRTDAVAARVIDAWIAEQVPQCGYCAPGMIIATIALLRRTPQPGDQEIDAAITNLCRCGTYPRIRRALHRAASTTP